ncbi:MAG: thioredoxin family protein [Bacteroidales bacterium]|nr:thioredoxin family protein [Bacteroidales bacterium]NPV35319.1 thioredoxin family protein [Bacteroidales bacterium]
MNIKVLGTGCPKCKALEKAIREVVEENHYDAQIEKVEDIVKIMNYGILATPGMVINEKVVSSGRLLSKDEIKTLIEKHING